MGRYCKVGSQEKSMKLALIDVDKGFECLDPQSPEEGWAEGRLPCAIVRPGVRSAALCVVKGEIVELLQVRRKRRLKLV